MDYSETPAFQRGVKRAITDLEGLQAPPDPVDASDEPCQRCGATPTRSGKVDVADVPFRWQVGGGKRARWLSPIYDATWGFGRWGWLCDGCRDQAGEVPAA